MFDPCVYILVYVGACLSAMCALWCLLKNIQGFSGIGVSQPRWHLQLLVRPKSELAHRDTHTLERSDRFQLAHVTPNLPSRVQNF
jgi:hypothetical protein